MANNDFSRRLTLLRKERGSSQRQCADDLGISQALLSHYEKGVRECGLDFVVKASQYFGVSSDYLLGLSVDKTGAKLDMDTLPDETAQGKENTFKGSILPTLNKRLLFNSLNIVFDLVSEAKDSALTNEISSYLSFAVYKMFRYLYGYNSSNPDTLFSSEQALFLDITNAAMNLSEMQVKCALGSVNSKTYKKLDIQSEKFTLNQQLLEQRYPMLTPSLLNLIKNAETKMSAREWSVRKPKK